MNFFRNLSQAFRALLRNPISTIVAVGVLALGIGATTAIFTIIDAALIRPLPGVRDPANLVLMQRIQGGQMLGNFGYPDFRDYRNQARSFSGIAASGATSLSFNHGDVTERVSGRIVSGNYFSILGVQPVEGRLIQDVDEESRAANAVLSFGFWQRAFASDPSAVGRVIELNGNAFTIVGVAARNFSGTEVAASTDVWLPVTLQPLALPMSAGAIENRSFGWLTLFGRLQTGVTVAQAQGEINVIAASLGQLYPESNAHRTVQLFSGLGMEPEARQTLTGFLGLLLGAVFLLLLIACANVSSLLLARGVTRRREMAVRLALGANLLQIARQLLTEALIMTTAAAMAGLLVASIASEWIVTWQASSYGLQNLDLSFDPGVFAFILAVSVITAVLCTLAPLWQAAQTDLITDIKQGTSGSGRRMPRFQQALIVGQVALSLVLLVGAGLVIRTTYGVLTTDQGFETKQIAIFGLDLTSNGYSADRAERTSEQMLEHIQAVHGVTSVSLAGTVPPDEISGRVSVFHPGEQPSPQILHAREIELEPRVDTDSVGPQYLHTMGIAVLRGRDFTSQDRPGALPVAIVNERFAAQFWPGENAIGQRIFVVGNTVDDDSTVEVVGLARDTRYRSLLAPPPAILYLPVLQHGVTRTHLIVRTQMDPAVTIPEIVRAFQAADKNVTVYGIETMSQHVAASLWQQRIAEELIGLLGVLAVLLASVGLYGIIAHSVAERTREIGIRVAVGADSGSIRRLVIGQGLRLVLIGIAIGSAMAFGAAQFLRSLLYGISPHDPLTFVSVAALLCVVSLLAGEIPARRAMRIDPAAALRRD